MTSLGRDLFLGAVLAASLARGLPAGEEGATAYRAAHVVVAPGERVEPGVLIVKDGKVSAVLEADAEVPEGTPLVDLRDAHILPGFVNPLSTMSSRGYATSRRSVPMTAAGNPGDARRREAKSSVRPEDAMFRRLGTTGYAAFGWLPEGAGFLAGQAAVIRPALGPDDTAQKIVLREPAYLLMSYELGSRWRTLAERELKKAADAVVKERKAKDAKPDPKVEPDAPSEKKKETEAGKGQGEGGKPPPQPAPGSPPAAPPAKQGTPPKKPAPPDPLVLVFRGELDLLLRIRSPAALDHFFRLYDKLPLRPAFVLVTPSLPPETVKKVAARGPTVRAVIVEPRVASSSETSILTSTARLFLQAGKDVALVPLADSLAGHEGVLLHVAESIRCGLSEREALAGLTTTPARLLGLEGRVGVLREGASASFSVFRGDPFTGTARLEKVFVEGREVFSEDPNTLRLAGEAVR